MSSTAVKRKLSGSTDGKQIKVAATADPGTTIHTAVAGTTAGTYDEIWLWAYNSDPAAWVLTIEWGSNASPDDLMAITIPPGQGYTLLAPGLILQNGLVVKAYAGKANVIMINGFANSITD